VIDASTLMSIVAIISFTISGLPQDRPVVSPLAVPPAAGTSFQFFPGGGQNFDRLPRGGQNMKNTKFCRQKHQQVTIFQNQGGKDAPLPPPQNDVPDQLDGTPPPVGVYILLGNSHPSLGICEQFWRCPLPWEVIF